MKKYKILLLGGLLTLLGAMALPLAGSAVSNYRSGNDAAIARDETVDGSAYLAGNNVNVAGVVRGDLYCLGQSVEVTGTVEGDIICAGQTVSISGNVLGDVRVAGQTVTLSGPIAHSLTAFGQTVTTSGTAVINADATVYGSTVQLGGKIGRDATIGGQNVTMAGNIVRNVDARAERLSLSAGAKVGGNVDYTSWNNIETGRSATVAGKTQRHDPPVHEKREAVDSWVAAFWSVAFWFGSTLLLGLLILALGRGSYHTVNERMIHHVGWSLLAGLVALIMTPIIAVMLMVTIIGIPAGIVLLLLWIVALIASFSYSSYSAGRWIATQAKWKLKWPDVSALALGLLVLAVLMLIPVIGGMFSFLALVWGLGGLTLSAGTYLHGKGEVATKKAKA